MIVKTFETPYDLLQLEALNRRLPDNHPKKGEISITLYKKLAGQSGEKEAYYQLGFLPKNKFRIFHNLRLPDTNSYFQLDFVVLSPGFVIIFEVKNYKGVVYLNDIHQLIHIKENQAEEIYDNPISQADRHAFQFQNWLYQHGYFHIPIFSYVVLSSGTRLLKTNSTNEEILQKIIPVSNMVNKVLQLSSQYSQSQISKKEMDKLSKKLLESHSPLNRNLLEENGIVPGDLIKGVQCENCNSFPMARQRRRWICLNCYAEGKNNHIQALNDYYLLISNSVSNRDVRDFLQIQSPTIAYKLLKYAGYQSTGKSNGTKYILEYRIKGN